VRLARYEDLVDPWVDQVMERAVLIRLDMVNGFRMTAADAGTGAGSTAGAVPEH
jgi:hypothetical protein